MPWFLTLLVGLELFSVLIAYPLVSPPEILLYLTPTPLFLNQSLSILALSFLIVFVLLLITLKAYKFTLDILNLRKNKLIPSIIISILISFSLAIFVYEHQFSLYMIPAYLFFILNIFLVGTQLDVVLNSSNEE